MRNFFPKSLQGQMLLSVAIALLVAQALSAIFLVRAEQRRIDISLIHGLAFQLASNPQLEFDAGRRFGPKRAARRQLRIESALNSPVQRGEFRDQDREESLSEVLENHDVEIEELVVLTRPVASDPYILQGINGSGGLSRPFRGPKWNPKGFVLLAGLKSEKDGEWLVARVPVPSSDPQALRGILFQTLVLYIVLIGGMAFILRRVTRPLAMLTKRVNKFTGRPEEQEPLTPSGPEDMRSLIAAHNRMEERISALLDEKDVMLGAIGHDLKTPLAALRVRIESVEDDNERAKMAASIEDITLTLDDILTLARIGRPSDGLEKTDLRALIASVVEEYEDMGENVILGQTDRVARPIRATWLRRALRNLISNALRYGDEALVSLHHEDKQVIISIADKGPGIAENEIATMLEPFQRGDASRNRATGGAGLGLTLARAIAERHGGSLKLSNRTGMDGKCEGLIAQLILPLD